MDVNKILLGLLGRALFHAEFAFDTTAAPWEALFAESRAQTVELLVLEALTDAERAAMADAVRTNVWPQLAQNTSQEFLDGILASIQ